MPLSDKKRLKKLAKKKKKRTVLKKINQKITHRPMSMQPIQCCGISETLFHGDRDSGIGHVIIARGDEMEVKAGIFLVDSWCLGIKDCFTCNIDTHKIAEKFSQPDNQLQKIPPSSAKAFIMQASHYAKNLGFNPMGDFDKCWKLFHDVKTDGDHPLLTFGKDGKPFYIAGPHDDGNFQRKVMATLNKSVGPDNYHFVLPVQP